MCCTKVLVVVACLAICKLPVESGPCMDAEFTRWAFDEQRQTCVAFTYHGCAGNLNRFKTFKGCLDYCLPGQRTVDTDDLSNRQRKCFTGFVIQ